jgi:hypothetical protein
MPSQLLAERETRHKTTRARSKTFAQVLSEILCKNIELEQYIDMRTSLATPSPKKKSAANAASPRTRRVTPSPKKNSAAPARATVSRHFKRNTITLSCVIGLTVVASVADSSSLPDFASFLPTVKSPERKKPSAERWKIVTPLSRGKATLYQTTSGGNRDKYKTKSFGAMTAANFTNLQDKNIKIHTLILGTHPSIKSFEEQAYFAHPIK